MKTCEYIKTCRFLLDKMELWPDVAFKLKRKYCLNDPSICARNMVGKELDGQIPSNLFPNQIETAKKLLEKIAETAGKSEK